MEVPVACNGDAEASKTISMKQRKQTVARRYITKNAPLIVSLAEKICSGDRSTFETYEALIGPVPEEV